MTASAPCPRCAAPLEPARQAGVEHLACGACGGIEVRQRDLARLLRSLAREGPPPEAPAPDSGETLRCSRCARPLDPFPYLGQRELILDRCEECERVWLDPHEAEAAAALQAASEQRVEEHARALEKHRLPTVLPVGHMADDDRILLPRDPEEHQSPEARLRMASLAAIGQHEGEAGFGSRLEARETLAFVASRLALFGALAPPARDALCASASADGLPAETARGVVARARQEIAPAPVDLPWRERALAWARAALTALATTEAPSDELRESWADAWCRVAHDAHLPDPTDLAAVCGAPLSPRLAYASRDPAGGPLTLRLYAVSEGLALVRRSGVRRADYAAILGVRLTSPEPDEFTCALAIRDQPAAVLTNHGPLGALDDEGYAQALRVLHARLRASGATPEFALAPRPGEEGRAWAALLGVGLIGGGLTVLFARTLLRALHEGGRISEGLISGVVLTGLTTFVACLHLGLRVRRSEVRSYAPERLPTQVLPGATSVSAGEALRHGLAAFGEER